MGGTLTIEDNIGGGTVATISVAGEAAVTEEEKPAQGRPRRDDIPTEYRG